MLKYASILILFLAFVSCEQKKQQTQSAPQKPKMSIVKKHKKPKNLNKTATKSLKNWKQYNTLSKRLQSFENISPTKAFNNALDLKNLVKEVKDSIAIKALKTSAFKARLNVLENETLRLADMTYIPAITADEINKQVAKILLVFSSLNMKINTTYNQKVFNDEIDLNSFFELDNKAVKEKQELEEYPDN